MLKPSLVLALCVGIAVLASGSTATQIKPQPSTSIPPVFSGLAAGTTHAKAVRAEYSEPQGNRTPPVNTDLVIANTSATKWLRLKDLVVLGRDGLRTVLVVHRGFNGRQIPPLGQVLVHVDTSIGVTPRKRNVARSARDVASAVVLWEGSADALRLTSIVKEHSPGNGWGYTATSVEHGYDLKF